MSKWLKVIFTWFLTLVTAKHSHKDAEQSRPNFALRPSFLTIDGLGNCYAHDRPLVGRCVRSQDCISGLRAWREQGIEPMSCYYTTYENFVCCPHGGYALPQSALRQQTQRKSQEMCDIVYFGQNRHHRRRRRHNKQRVRRSEKFALPVVEAPLEKVNASIMEAVGGIRTMPDEYPYMCALGWRSSRHGSNKYVYNCGCVLIAKKYVLTAAHCAHVGGESPTVVLLGGVDLYDSRAELIEIKRITEHPDYDQSYNDIALVQLKKNSRQRPACLWSIETLPQQQLIALGYGQIKFGGPSSSSLLQVFLSVLTNQQCNRLLGAEDLLSDGIARGQICAGDSNGKMDTCQGDSGGPLLMHLPKDETRVPYVIGLTSMGQGCATGAPSIYTRMSYYIDWIEQIVWRKKN